MLISATVEHVVVALYTTAGDNGLTKLIDFLFMVTMASLYILGNGILLACIIYRVCVSLVTKW